MIIGIGTDLVNIQRIEKLYEKSGESFLKRCFHPDEIISFQNHKRPQFLATRFAAKEAFSKAIGTGIGEHLTWTDICIENDESGKPYIKVSDKVASFIKCKYNLNKMVQIDLSLSDEHHYCVAFVVLSL